MTKRKNITLKEWDSALFNLDSMRTSLLECDDSSKIEEIENLLRKMYMRKITYKEWKRIKEIVAERQMQRYITCVNNGIDENVSAEAFDD